MRLKFLICGVIAMISATVGAVQTQAIEYPQPEDVTIELRSANFDYVYEPTTEYRYQDVWGKFTFSCFIRGTEYIVFRDSRPHYATWTGDGFLSYIPSRVNPEGEIVEFCMPSTSWGTFGFLGFPTGPEGEEDTIYPFVIKTTDYVDPEIMVLLWPGFSGAGEVETTDASLTLEGEEIVARNIPDGEISIIICNVSGQTVVSRSISSSFAEARCDVSGLIPGIYVVRATGSSFTLTKKILKR